MPKIDCRECIARDHVIINHGRYVTAHGLLCALCAMRVEPTARRVSDHTVDELAAALDLSQHQERYWMQIAGNAEAARDMESTTTKDDAREWHTAGAQHAIAVRTGRVSESVSLDDAFEALWVWKRENHR